MPKATKRLVILDTHAILHRAYHALPELSSSRGEPTGALYGLVSMLVRIASDLGPDYIAAAYDLPGPTHRHAAYKDYKGTRVKTDDALVAQIDRSRAVVEALGIPIYDAPGFEADDVVGTLVAQLRKKKDVEIIIASGDMDTLQLIEGERVRVFTMRTGLTDVVLYDEDKVKERYGFGPELVPDYKGLMGDPSDNIKGVPGVGEGSAKKLIQTFGSVESLYKAIKKKGVEAVATEAQVQRRFVQLVADHKEDAEFSKVLATIRTDAPVTFILPKKTWRQSADPHKALDMLGRFEFRTLVPRVRKLFGGLPAEGATSEQNSLVEPTETATRGLFGRGVAPEDVDPEEIEKAKLAAWVLDSGLTEPTYDDVLRVGKASTFNEAYKNLLREIKAKELDFVYEKIELPLRPVLRTMERRGVLIDKKFLSKLSKEYSQELKKIATRIYKHAGGEFNVSSPRQLGEVLFDKLGLTAKKKTSGGARSTREEELQRLKGEHPIIEDVLAHRELSKLLSTYIDTLPTLLDKQDRLHTTFVQTGAATGRLASQNPNLQNIPIKTELGRAIRHAFIASPGMKLLSFDYNQVELRVAAILSEDPGLIEIFGRGGDIHSEVAARVFHVDPNKVNYEQRRRAKVINFGIMYGMGVNSLRDALGVERREAQEFYNQYFAAFPRLAAYIDETKVLAARRGYTQTLFGRRRYFEGIHSSIPYVRAAAERMAVNAPIQGTATGDIPKIAMIRLDTFLAEDGRKGHLLLQVHDELLFEIEESKLEEYAPEIKRIMETIVPENQSNGVPITVEGKMGSDWGDMQKI